MKFITKHAGLLLIGTWLFAMSAGVATYVVLKSHKVASHNSFSFGETVRFQKKGFNFCNGMIRNPLAFGYFEIDAIECVMLADKTVRVDFKQDPVVLSEHDLKQVFHKDSDHYSIVAGVQAFDKDLFFKDDNGNWVSNVQR